MLIPESTFTWTWAGTLAVVVLSALYLKLTGWALFRRGKHGAAFMRVGGAFAIAAATVVVFLHFERRGNDVWIYRESNGALSGREFILFGNAKVPTRNSPGRLPCPISRP